MTNDNDADKKRSDVLAAIEEDPVACDFLFSIFSGAAISYRYDSILRPFPSTFMENGEKNIERLRTVIEKVPSLTAVLESRESVDDECIDLLHWCLCSLPFKVRLSSYDRSDGESYIFEFIASDQQQRCFEDTKARSNSSVFLAYHGTKLENVFSIMSCGLLSHLNKVGIFGAGTYLSTESGLSMTFSTSATVWEGSNLGDMLRCVLHCEVIADHPDVRICSRDKKIPEKYILVKNNSAIKLKQCLLYASPKKSTQQILNNQDAQGLSGKIWRYLRNNMSSSLLLLYVLVLISINAPTYRLWSFIPGFGSR